MSAPVVKRAQADVAAGRLWKARDRLQGAVRQWPPDQDVLGLLGEVLFEMGDLPRAGLVWYLTDLDGPSVEAATTAMHERHPRPVGLIDALPLTAPIEAYPPAAQRRLEDLRSSLDGKMDWSPPARPQRPPPPPMGWRDVGGIVFAIALVGCFGVGVLTVIQWLIP